MSVLHIILKKYSLRYYFLLFVPFVLINLGWCFYNYHVSNIFFISNPERIYSEVAKSDFFNDNLTVSQEEWEGTGIKYTVKNTTSNYMKLKLDLLHRYLFNISEGNCQFYYNALPRMYMKLYDWKQINNPAYLTTPVTIPPSKVPESLRKLVYKEYSCIDKPPFSVNLENFKSENKYKNLWLLLYHLYYRFYSFIFSNVAWVVLFILILLYSIIVFIKSKFNNTLAFILMNICLIHFLSVVTISFTSGRFIARYVETTEFVVYIILPFCWLLIFNNVTEQNHSRSNTCL
jgi:hypothetical protein